MTYDFNGTKVTVNPGEVSHVVTDTMGGSVSVISKKNIERELERGIWVDSYVYRINDSGVELVSQPGGES